jgi:DNA-binding transcriptional MerR regulator
MGTSSRNGSDPTSRLLRIGELARATGKTNRALHLYEELGIIRPLARTRGGFRLYAPECVARVAWIDRLRDLGLSLTQISAFVNDVASVREGPRAMALVRGVFHAKLSEVRGALARLSSLERDLVEGLAYLSECEQCTPPRATTQCTTCDQPHACVTRPALIEGLHADVRAVEV